MPPKTPKPPRILKAPRAAPPRLPAKPTPTSRPSAGHYANPAKFVQSTPPPPPPIQTHFNPSESHYDGYTARPSSRYYLKWTGRGITFLCGLLMLRDHVIDYQHVRGSSMTPTLNPTSHETGDDDYVIIRPWRAASLRGGVQNEIQRGDVVTFWKPHRPEEISIKRVVALEGDTVLVHRGYALDAALRVNRLQGVPDGLPDVDGDAVAAGGGEEEEEEEEELGKVVVPYGHVWIEGDNWRNSLDSNDFGPISKGQIIGKATWIWRTWTQFKRMGDERDEKDIRTKVVEGKAEVPVRFLD